jgi:hypothetical protein
LLPLAPGFQFKILRVHDDFHVVIECCTDSQANSNADREVDAPFSVRAVRNLGVFSSTNDAVVPIPEAEGRLWEAPEAMDMSGCDQCFNVIRTVRLDFRDGKNESSGIFMRDDPRFLLLRLLSRSNLAFIHPIAR